MYDLKLIHLLFDNEHLYVHNDLLYKYNLGFSLFFSLINIIKRRKKTNKNKIVYIKKTEQ
jgi:hypothetical protein